MVLPVSRIAILSPYSILIQFISNRLAVYFGDYQCVEKLLDAGANPDIRMAILDIQCEYQTSGAEPPLTFLVRKVWRGGGEVGFARQRTLVVMCFAVTHYQVTVLRKELLL